MDDDHKNHKRRSDEFIKQNIESEFNQAQSFDKSLLTVTSGALGLTILFIKDFTPEPTHQYALVGCWIFFAATILCLLSSMLTSQSGYRREREACENELQGKEIPVSSKQNPFIVATHRLNLASVIAFGIGVLFLMQFITCNVGGSGTVDDNAHTKKYVGDRNKEQKAAVPPKRPALFEGGSTPASRPQTTDETTQPQQPTTIDSLPDPTTGAVPPNRPRVPKPPAPTEISD